MSIKFHTLFAFSLILFTTFVIPTEVLAVVKNLNGQTGDTQTFQNDPNVTISSSGDVHSLGWLGLLPISRGGTGAGSFTLGSILFSNGTAITQDNSNFFWDDTNNRLGIGTSSPTSTLDVNGNTKITGNLDVTGNITGNVTVTNVVPYTGATENVNLGTYNLTANSLISTTDSIINSLTIGRGGGSNPDNVAIGINALSTNTGTRNTAIGTNALKVNTHSDSTAVGHSALGSISNDGDQNTAVGSQSLQANTTGGHNNAYGYNALQFNTTGDSNVGIGLAALQSNTTGSANIAVGIGALSNNINGESNIGIGQNALVNQTNDNHSIVIGRDAIGAGSNTAVIGNSAMTDVYFGSSAGLAGTHAKRMFLGSSSVPGCIIMGDTAGGVGYITLDSGVLTVSSSPPSACQ